MSETESKSPEPPAFKVGDTIATHYRLEKALNPGGMGLTFLASDVRESQSQSEPSRSSDWVLKVLPDSLLSGDVELHRERFLSSAILQARLSIPGVAAVRDYGQQSDYVYMVMPYDPNRRPLRELLEERPDKQLQWSEAVELLTSVAQTLEKLHHANVIHRDIKPSNLLVHKGHGGWQAQLIDFGIVKDLGAGESLTKTGQSPGFSQQYAAPELHRSSGDARSDLFSLGITILESLTGQCLPAKGPNDLDGVKVPGALHRLIRELTDADPEARPKSATIVLARIAKFDQRTALLVLLAVLTTAAVIAALWLGKRELDKNSAHIKTLGRNIANLKAENSGLVTSLEKLEAKGKVKVEAPKGPKDLPPNPVLKGLELYNSREIEDRKMRSMALDVQTVEALRDAWADLEQRSRPGAVRDAAHSWKLLYESVQLRRRYRILLRKIVKPFDPGQNELYLDFTHGETSVRFDSLKATRKDGIASFDFGDDASPLILDMAHGAKLELKLYESRFGFDRVLFEEKLDLALPIDWTLITDGTEIEIAGKDGLRLTVMIRRE